MLPTLGIRIYHDTPVSCLSAAPRAQRPASLSRAYSEFLAILNSTTQVTDGTPGASQPQSSPPTASVAQGGTPTQSSDSVVGRGHGEDRGEESDHVGERARLLQRMVESHVVGRINSDELLEALRAERFTAVETAEALEQAKQRREAGRPPTDSDQLRE